MTLTPEERRRRNTESVRRVRMRETPEQYEERLRRARERYYAKKIALVNSTESTRIVDITNTVNRTHKRFQQRSLCFIYSRLG
ncbi:hypothetical protein DVH05_027272 [Phytophthora capsici]|nr:hypothetical protein DVH05_027272 [Phytophthora capsici]